MCDEYQRPKMVVNYHSPLIPFNKVSLQQYEFIIQCNGFDTVFHPGYASKSSSHGFSPCCKIWNSRFLKHPEN